MPAGFQPAKTIIYRSRDTEPISIYYTLEGADQFIEDMDIEINTAYNYRIRVFGTSGNTIVSSRLITFTPLSKSISEVK
jgi:predicted RNA-binding protein with PIN domain